MALPSLRKSNRVWADVPLEEKQIWFAKKTEWCNRVNVITNKIYHIYSVERKEREPVVVIKRDPATANLREEEEQQAKRAKVSTATSVASSTSASVPLATPPVTTSETAATVTDTANVSTNAGSVIATPVATVTQAVSSQQPPATTTTTATTTIEPLVSIKKQKSSSKPHKASKVGKEKKKAKVYLNPPVTWTCMNCSSSNAWVLEVTFYDCSCDEC
jgi:hypothetical protein